MEINYNSAVDYFADMMEEIQKGKDYVIIRGGRPVARISPVYDNALARKDIVERLFHYQAQKNHEP
jgi:antitoxin (DNA-binding transcriptional repressor) of toxin-antitoxin stability system